MFLFQAWGHWRTGQCTSVYSHLPENISLCLLLQLWPLWPHKETVWRRFCKQENGSLWNLYSAVKNYFQSVWAGKTSDCGYLRLTPNVCVCVCPTVYQRRSLGLFGATQRERVRRKSAGPSATSRTRCTKRPGWGEHWVHKNPFDVCLSTCSTKLRLRLLCVMSEVSHLAFSTSVAHEQRVTQCAALCISCRWLNGSNSGIGRFRESHRLFSLQHLLFADTSLCCQVVGVVPHSALSCQSRCNFPLHNDWWWSRLHISGVDYCVRDMICVTIST